MDMTAHGHAHPKKAVHNMALVGDHHVFLSHLPMFMAPHDAQVLLDAAFTKGGKNIDDIYFADRAANPTVRSIPSNQSFFVLRSCSNRGRRRSERASKRRSFEAISKKVAHRLMRSRTSTCTSTG